jgi:hypothetical protein
MMMLG